MRTQITSLSQLITQQAAGSRRSKPSANGTAGFNQLLAPKTAPAGGVKRLGPFTSDPGMKPAATAPVALTAPPAASQPAALAVPQMPAPVSWNPYDRTSHEARMNAWYMGYVQNRNDEKMRIYQMALHDWQINDEIYKNLGMPPVPKPTPPPLDPVAPMPAGWWMANGNLTT